MVPESGSGFQLRSMNLQIYLHSALHSVDLKKSWLLSFLGADRLQMDLSGGKLIQESVLSGKPFSTICSVQPGLYPVYIGCMLDQSAEIALSECSGRLSVSAAVCLAESE